MKAETAKKIENCLVAIDMVKSLPARAFTHDLATWTCGSAACLGGWIAQHPYFQKQGVLAAKDEGGEPYMFREGGGRRWASDVANELFDDHSLFSQRNTWKGTDVYPASDKRVALNRLEQALNALLDKN